MGGNFFLFFYGGNLEAHQTFQSKRMGHVSCAAAEEPGGLDYTTTPVFLQVKGYFNVQSFLQRARSSSGR